MYGELVVLFLPLVYSVIYSILYKYDKIFHRISYKPLGDFYFKIAIQMEHAVIDECVIFGLVDPQNGYTKTIVSVLYAMSRSGDLDIGIYERTLLFNSENLLCTALRYLVGSNIYYTILWHFMYIVLKNFWIYLFFNLLGDRIEPVEVIHPQPINVPDITHDIPFIEPLDDSSDDSSDESSNDENLPTELNTLRTLSLHVD